MANDKVLISPRVNPDIDGFACAYAYAELLRKASKYSVCGIWGELSHEIKFLLGKYDFPDWLHAPTEAFEQFILVDASFLNFLPPLFDPQKVSEIIDHRESPNVATEFPNARIQIDKVGAAATLIVEKFRDTNAIISFASAILLYCAIYSNTLNFQVRNRSERDKKSVEWLLSRHRIPPNIQNEMFAFKTNYIKENLRAELFNEPPQIKVNGQSVTVPQLELINGKVLLQENIDQFNQLCSELQSEFDYVLIVLQDISLGKSIFFALEQNTQKVISELFNVKFMNNIAVHTELIMRKEIRPMIINYLERE